MNEGEPTNAELRRHLESISGDVKEIKKELKDVPDWHDIRRVEATWQALLTVLQGRVTALENRSQGGAARFATIASPVVAIVALVVTLATLIDWNR